jgi:hypothetical protein
MSIPQNPDPTMPVPQSGPPVGGDPTVPVAPGGGDATIPVQPGYGGGTGGPGVPGGPVGPDDDDADRRKLWLIAGGVLVLGLIVGGIIALLASGGGDETATTSTSSSSSSTSSSTTSSSLATTTTAATTPQGPQINQFTVSQNPVSCPGTSNIVLTWTTQNSESVTISIDNPNGPYGTYGPSSQQQVPFACGAGPGPVQHTYYLAANGANNQKTTKQIQVTGNFPPATTTTTTTAP